jgi:selenoprotein W-related protein
VSLTNKLLTTFNKKKISEFVLIPSDGGRFEIEVDGELIYSKLQTGQFPDEDAIAKDIQKRLK